MNWKKFLINEKSLINKVVKNLNSHGLKICFVVNSKNELIGTVTDGDIRRGFLRGCRLSDSVEKILNKKFFSIQKNSHIKKNIFKIMKKKILILYQYYKIKKLSICIFLKLIYSKLKKFIMIL